MANATCSIVDVDGRCPNPAKTRGMCVKHYSRWHRWGDPLATQRRWSPYNLLARMVQQPNGCVWFAGAVDKKGYGIITWYRTPTRAHLAAWLHFRSPIPDGMQVDHACHNQDPTCAGGNGCLHRRCVNPDHLRLVTSRENTLAGRTIPAMHAAKTHCIHGHEFTPENTYTKPGSTRRDCRQCRKNRRPSRP